MRSLVAFLKQSSATTTAVALALVLVGCGKPDLGPAVDQPVVDLAQLSLRYPKSAWRYGQPPGPNTPSAAPNSADFAVQATLNGDRRAVLPLTWPATRSAFELAAADSPRQSRLDLLGPVFADSESVLLAWAGKDSAGVEKSGSTLAQVEHGGIVPQASFSLAAGEATNGIVEAYPLPDRGRLWHATRPVRVRDGSRLDFATGVLEQSGSNAAIQFSVSACTAWRCKEIWTFVTTADQAGETWTHHSVALDALAGSERAFLFEAQFEETQHPLPAFANPQVRQKPVTASLAPNIILLAVDGLRASQLSSSGYLRPTTPGIDAALSAKGVHFESGNAAAGSIIASNMSLLSGLEPSIHAKTEQSVAEASLPLIAERLAEAGYTTHAIVESPWMHPSFGFGSGFESFRLLATRGSEPTTSLWDAAADIPTSDTSPWFLFLQTDRLLRDESPEAKPEESFEKPLAADQALPEHVAKLRLAYDQKLLALDGQITNFLKSFDEDTNTIVILTSGFGYEFGEHGHLGHGLHLYEEVTRIPILMRGPGIEAGKRIGEAVGAIDIAPTLLELASAPPLANTSGRSLLPYLKGEELDGAEQRTFIAEQWSPSAQTIYESAAGTLPPTFAIKRGTKKLVSENGRLRGRRWDCYDLESDPNERSMIDACRDLKAKLEAWPARAKERRSAILEARSASASGLRSEVLQIEAEAHFLRVSR